MFFDHYPYTNFHNVNLDWVLQAVKSWGALVEANNQAFKDLKEANEDFKNYVENYLHVVIPEEIASNIEEAVSKWLDEHPEATTTVQDHSLTHEKLVTGTLGFVTPEMYGAKGDGVTDDTAAFQAMAAAQDVIVVIPDKSYVINDRVVLPQPAIIDNGNYQNYVPEYAKPLSLNMAGLAFGDNIELPIAKSYAESITYLRGGYYVIAQDYTTSPARNYIALYDSNMTYQSMVYTDTVYGVSNNSSTDGTYLYVDFDNGYHCIYDPANLASAMFARQDRAFRNVEYYNKQLYAIAFGTNNVSVSTIDNTLTTLSNTWTVNTESQTLQSATIHEGQLYIPTTIGMFRVIDLISHDVLEVPYKLLKEVEKFYTAPDGKLAAMGHLYGFNGIFNVGKLNDGADADIVNYIPLDGSAGDVRVTSRYRSNVYNVSNGLQAGFPLDNCDVIIFDHIMLALDRSNNSIYSYSGNQWKYMGPVAPYNILIEDRLYITYDVGGGFTIAAYDKSLTTAQVDITHDFSDIYSRCGLADGRYLQGFAISRQAGVQFPTADLYCIQILISKTYIRLNVRNLTNPSSSTINCNATFRIKLF